jgi:hypothetical protein
VPYVGSWLDLLNISAIDGLDLYPDLFVHDDRILITPTAWQEWDFVGNAHTLWVPVESYYTAYAMGDWVNLSLEYILANRTFVPGGGASLILNLSTARRFTVQAETWGGDELQLYEWRKRFITYSERYLSVSYTDGAWARGNRTIFISPKPAHNLHTDIILKYHGIPV